MAKRSSVTLTADERADRMALTKQGQLAARQRTRAHMLLRADAGDREAVMAAARHVGSATVARVRQRCVKEGLEAALHERPRPGGQRQLQSKQEAFLSALACSPPPEGRTSWTMP